jgi:hypothetical protein
VLHLELWFEPIDTFNTPNADGLDVWLDIENAMPADIELYPISTVTSQLSDFSNDQRIVDSVTDAQRDCFRFRFFDCCRYFFGRQVRAEIQGSPS